MNSLYTLCFLHWLLESKLDQKYGIVLVHAHCGMGKERLEYISDLDPLLPWIWCTWSAEQQAQTCDIHHEAQTPQGKLGEWRKSKPRLSDGSEFLDKSMNNLTLTPSVQRQKRWGRQTAEFATFFRTSREGQLRARKMSMTIPSMTCNCFRKKKHGNGPANNSRTSKGSSHIFPEVHFPASFFGDLVVSGNQRVSMISVLTEACLLVVFLHVPQAVQNNQPPCPQFSQQL